jgi:hypothetical protein
MASTAYNPVVTYRQIGFRVFSLVTVNDSDPAPYENDNGSGNFTTRWKVNGANVSFNNKNKKKTKNNKKSYIVSQLLLVRYSLSQSSVPNLALIQINEPDCFSI